MLWPAVGTIPDALLDAAAVDGFGPWGRARRVALPLSRPALAASWAVALVLAFGALPASKLVKPPGFTTLAFRVRQLHHIGVESHLAGVGLILLAVYGLAALAATRVLGRLVRG